jgi:hypothetical protein
MPRRPRLRRLRAAASLGVHRLTGMVVRLTHRPAGDLIHRTFQALGRSFSLTGVASALRRTWRLTVPDKIPYLMGMQDVSHTLGSSGLPWTNTTTLATYATLQAAINAASAGHTLTAPAGSTFTEWPINVTKSLTIRSATAGSKITFNSSSTSLAGGGSQFLISASSATVVLQDLTIYGNHFQYSSFNSGISLVGTNTNLTVRRCKIYENSNGIISGAATGSGTILIEDCEVHDNGDSSGQMHNIYVNEIDSCTIRGTWVHNTKSREDFPGLEWKESGGHLVKSRSKALTVEGCRLTMEKIHSATWGANRCIDYPNAGDLTVRGNLIEYRTNQNNGVGQAISWGVEGAGDIPGTTWDRSVWRINIQQNTIVARSTHSSGNVEWLWLANGKANTTGNTSTVPNPSVYSVADNIFCGWVNNPPRTMDGPLKSISTTYAISNTTNTCGALSLLTDATTYNYAPVTPVIGSQQWTNYSYDHPTSTTTRADAYRGAVYTGWGAGATTGSYNSTTFKWIPGRDAGGRVNQVSWDLLPINTWIEVDNTWIGKLDATVKASIPLWQDYGGEDWNAVVNSWNGMAVDTRAGNEKAYLAATGGHNASSNNGVYYFDFRKMDWFVERLPTDPQYMATEYKTQTASFTIYGPAQTEYLANPTGGRFHDEIFNTAAGIRHPTSRHQYNSQVFVPTLGTAGKILFGCRRYWEYDFGTQQWSAPINIGGLANPGQFNFGENMSAWWDAGRQRYYFTHSEGNYWYSPSLGTWGQDAGFMFGSNPTYYSGLEQVDADTVYQLAYHDNLPPTDRTGLPKSFKRLTLSTQAIKTYQVILDSSLSSLTSSAYVDGQCVTYVAPLDKFLAVIATTQTGEALAWGTPGGTEAAPSITFSLATMAGKYQQPFRTENKLKYIPSLGAIVWIWQPSSELQNANQCRIYKLS